MDFNLHRRREGKPGVINHPKQYGKGDIESDFNLAKVDRSAGVRKSRESMEDAIEMGDAGGRTSGGGKKGADDK